MSQLAKKYVFVGAVSKPADGTLGGQLFACTLLLESPLQERIDWQLIDSSQKSQPPPPVIMRAWPAVARIFKSTFNLIRPSVKGGLVFSSYQTFSLLEKTAICLIGRVFRKRMVTTYRSEVRRLGKPDWILHPLMSLSFRLGTRVICQSTAAAEKLTEFFPHVQPNITIIPNWIEPKKYQINPPDRQNTDTPKILFIGWLEKNKGVHDLLVALSKIKQKGIAFKLVVGGSGSQHQPLIEQAASLGLADSVDFRGWISGAEKLAALAEANVFVLQSYHEGMPNSVLEAMSCGLPIVATSVGGIPQLVCDDGSILVPSGSPDELANALEQTLIDPERRKKMGTANRSHVEKNHDIDVIWPRVATTLDVL